MAKKRRQFQRQFGKRRYRKLFIIASEGSKTEPGYFSIFNSDKAVIHIKCLFEKHHSAPKQVLRNIKRYLKEENLRKTDEAWIVVDKDEWEEEQLQQLYNWSEKQGNYGLAVSTPKFEYWLLLHFEDGSGITSTNCSERLRRHLPNYIKSVDKSKITDDSIHKAIERAKIRDSDPSLKWPETSGSTVYKLVENILQA